ncbi:MAG: type II toxin-antitoxin system prevent-host-death family antitoxin [Acidobacteriota bacterium]|nr:type II toxin-antitoxin system prevent-host-death family antitoxin [Acidobacteriota bacterium]
MPLIIEAAMQVNLEDGEVELAKLVELAMRGEDIVVAKAGRPVVKLSKVPQSSTIPAKNPILGLGAGEVQFLDPDWDKPMTEEELSEFYGL